MGSTGEPRPCQGDLSRGEPSSPTPSASTQADCADNWGSFSSPRTALKAEWYLENSRNREHHISRPLCPTQGSPNHTAPPHTAGTSSWAQEVALLPLMALAKGKAPHPLLPTVQDSASPHLWHVLRRNTSKRATCPTPGAPRKHFWWQIPTGSDGSSGTPG